MAIRKLLVLGGGGAMGRAQTQVLFALESKAINPLWLEYDLIAGSSIGAIHAAIIGSGKMTARQLENNEDEMMTRLFGHKRLIPNFYDTKVFIKIWEELIGKDILFGDVKTKLLISSVERTQNRTVFFKSWEERDGNEKLIDIICRSFAAPIYFGQVVDPVNKRVYADGGMGEYNLPIDEVKFEAEVNGWYDGDNKVQIDAIGALFSDISISYEDAIKQKFLRQAIAFMNPVEGGMARAQCRNDQVRKMEKLAQVKKNINFRYFDCCIPEKFEGMDKIKYLSFYRDSGNIAAKKPIIEVNNF
jgi:hypothetical protein